MPQQAAGDVARGAQERDGQRREQPQPVGRGPRRRRRHRRRGPDDQALPAAGPGSGVPDPQAHDPHHRSSSRTRRPEHGTQGPSVRLPPRVSRAPGPRSGTRRQGIHRLLKEDITIRQLVDKRLANASVSGVEIERGINHVTVTIHTAKPGIVIGKGGAERRDPAPADRRAHDAQGQAGDQGDPPAGARRLPRGDEHRRAAEPPHRLQEGDEAGHPAVDEGRRQGRQDRASPVASAAPRWAAASGTSEGRIPLGTLRADISYGQVHAHTTYGRIGVKVWIYRGDITPERAAARRRRPGRRPGRGSDRC